MASGMEIRQSKSNFLYYCEDDEIRNHIATLLPFNMVRIDEGMKYVGFPIKPNGHPSDD